MLANRAEHYGHPGVGETVRPEIPSCHAAGEYSLRLGDGRPLDPPCRRLLPRSVGPCAWADRQHVLHAVARRPLLDAGGRRRLSVDHVLARVAARRVVATESAGWLWPLAPRRWPLCPGRRRRPRLAPALRRGVQRRCAAESDPPGTRRRRFADRDGIASGRLARPAARQPPVAPPDRRSSHSRWRSRSSPGSPSSFIRSSTPTLR